ncbi:hypothetical protein EDD15DRAFT_113913 [Pisolithus albus]|nr:hypothetical protein EDD15DRAFT_113913 [Pisolithus albus]
MPPNRCFRCDVNLVVVSCGPVYRRRAGNLNMTPLGNTTRVHPQPINLLVTSIMTRRCCDAETSKLEPFRPSPVSAWISVMFPGKASCILRCATLPGNTTTSLNLVCRGSCPFVFTCPLLVSRFVQSHVNTHNDHSCITECDAAALCRLLAVEASTICTPPPGGWWSTRTVAVPRHNNTPTVTKRLSSGVPFSPANQLIRSSSRPWKCAARPTPIICFSILDVLYSSMDSTEVGLMHAVARSFNGFLTHHCSPLPVKPLRSLLTEFFHFRASSTITASLTAHR